MRPLTLSILAVTIAEAGAAMVTLNAAPHQPLGLWLWFSGLAVLAPVAGFRLYKLAKARDKRNAQRL